MNARRITAAVLSALGLVAAGQSAAAAAAPQERYYVSLGDSLATGYQPGQGDTDQGYVEALYAKLKKRDPGLKLVKFGCAGETTTSLLKGGRCAYPGASGQLDAAVRFLKAHRGQARYLTLDIGGNDVGGCASGGGIDPACALRGVGTITTNLPQITGALKSAAGPRTRLLAMNYYDPFMAAWLQGADGQRLAGLSLLAINAVNALESSLYAGSGFRVADVAGRFSINDLFHKETLPGVGPVPRSVARVCTWTYMCARNDIHPNAEGYRQIAAAFEPLVRR